MAGIQLYHVNSLDYFKIENDFSIGRTEGTLVLESDSKLSGKHAVFRLKNIQGKEVLFIEDLKSKNGTVVNRIEIEPEVEIQLNLQTLVEVGDQMFIVTNKKLSLIETNQIVDTMTARSVVKMESKRVLIKGLEAELTAIEQKKEKLHAKAAEVEAQIANIQVTYNELLKRKELILQKLAQGDSILLTHRKNLESIHSELEGLEADTEATKQRLEKFKAQTLIHKNVFRT